jgi:hypothetical protein
LRIPAYQVYNVLQQYTDKLTNGNGGEDSGPGQETASDDAGFYATVKRREIIETITQTIKERISRVKPTGRQEGEAETLSPAAGQGDAAPRDGEFTPFVYNAIDKDHRKVKRTISVTRFYEP